MPPFNENDRDFVGLIVRNQAKLRAFIISLMPGVPGVAYVLQETNIVLWEKMKSFEPGTNFSAWAFAIARYEVMAHCRKIHRQQSAWCKITILCFLLVNGRMGSRKSSKY